MNLWLNYKTEDGVTRRVSVNAEKFTIGRHSDNDLCIPSNQLSRLHAEIDRYENAFILSDAGSSNGTMLNGISVSRPTALKNGDLINLGGAAAILVEITSEFANAKKTPTPAVATNEKAAEKAEAEAVKEAEIVSEVKVADFAPAIAQSAPEKKSGLGIFFLIVPVLVLFMLIIGGLILWLAGGNSKESDVSKTSGKKIYADDDDPPFNSKKSDNSNKTTSSNSANNSSSSSTDNSSSSSVNSSSSSTSTTDSGTTSSVSSTPISNENDTIEKNALSFMRRIANTDPNPVLTQKQIGEIGGALKSFRNSAALKDNLATLKKNSAQIETLAKSKNLRPQFLAVAALTKLGNSRGDALGTANAMAGDLNALSNIIANDFSDDSLIIIAAYSDGGGKSSMPSMIGNLTKNSPNAARQIRTIWFLHDNHKISDAQYNFALQFLAIGTITQNPKDFGVQTEAVIFN